GQRMTRKTGPIIRIRVRLLRLFSKWFGSMSPKVHVMNSVHRCVLALRGLTNPASKLASSRGLSRCWKKYKPPKTGGITFSTSMTRDGAIRFHQSVLEDRSRYIRLSEDNDALGIWSLERERPEVTKVLVAGQGEGDARTLKLVEGNTND